MQTQANMFVDAQRHATEVNKTFLHIVSCGLTRDELMRLIQQRPALWGRFVNWLDRLPTGNKRA